MRLLRFLLVGILFGIVMTKSEAISWYRIQEMFRFDSIHMYGIIGISVIGGIFIHLFFKSKEIFDADGELISFKPKGATYKANILGGTIFGLGWAMTGACPGPLYVLLGHGNWIIIVTILSAILGAFSYGALKSKLPH
ncbi:MAG: YeeE/YedE thiosulfate transporter family protein [Saprospiraceae bacterium]